MKRRKSRELALICLYQAEMRDELESNTDELLKSFWQEQDAEGSEIMEFTDELVSGTIKNRSLIDKTISASAINWSIKRMPCLDKNILRLAVFELLFIEDMPVLVSINEAIELAKKYSAEDAPRFINGVLHKIKEGLNKKDVKNDKIKESSPEKSEDEDSKTKINNPSP